MKCRYIDKYMSDIQSGKIPASKQMHQAMIYISGKLSNTNVFIDSEKIEKAIGLIEKYFEIKLLNWQLFAVSIMVSFGAGAESTEKVTGVITAAGSCVVYILAEASVDKTGGGTKDE